MSNGSTDWDQILIETSTSPRRISVDGVDYSGRSVQEILMARDHLGAEQAVCRGFRAGIRQQAVPPNALGIHLAGWTPGGRIW